MKNSPIRKRQSTSWESVGSWYHGLVGEEGHYYHRQIILPGVLRLLGPVDSLLDLACGNGVLARHLPKEVHYIGVDASSSLIKHAKQNSSSANQEFLIADIANPLKLLEKNFSHATLILAAQNLAAPALAMRNAARYLATEGKFIIVINHPCFRIPRQSSWGVDQEKKIQYRRIDRYQAPLKIPIQMNPSQKSNSSETWSFHYPLATFTKWLFEEGFACEWMEEWYSDKKSEGPLARMENRSRDEIPLFLAISAKKRASN